jgi:hypothetical protein
MSNVPKLAKIASQVPLLLVGSYGLFFWTYAFRISQELRPIADEICVLGEWDNGALFPPIHISPRFFASIFTWQSSIAWHSHYQITMLVHYFIAAALIALIARQIYFMSCHETLSLSKAITYSFVLTPWLLFSLPPNPTALFDAVFWFGGTWHVIGALIIAYTMLVIFDDSYNKFAILSLLVLSIFWSEIGSFLIISTQMIKVLLDRKINKWSFAAISMALLGLCVNIYVNVANKRIISIHDDASLDNMNVLKGSLKMIGEYSLRGALIAVIVKLAISHNVRMTERRKEYRYLSASVLSACSIFIVYQVGYPTWRSSFVIGILFFVSITLLVINVNAKKMTVLIPLMVIGAILGNQTVTNLHAIQNVAKERSYWWDGASSSNFTEQYRQESFKEDLSLPADFGSSTWINTCYRNFVKRNTG